MGHVSEDMTDMISFFREYPDYFLDYLKTENTMYDLLPFQRVYLRAFFRYKRVGIVASRGISKTYLNVLAHYLKCIVRDKVGSFKDRDAMERWLNEWIMNYVDGDPANSTQETKARKPLASAEVVVEEVEDNPGFYTSKFFLKPHYQLEGLTVSLRLVSKLPSAKEE